MAGNMNRKRRIEALEQADRQSSSRWHCIRRYEDETDQQAIEAYEAERGPIGDDNVIMRVIINKPGDRPNGISMP